MLLPLVASVLASLKSTAEAAAVPPTYFPHSLSLDSYERLWNYQAGLPTYFSNSLGAALHVRVTGENDHHKTEACFKAFGRALRQAVKSEGDALPSTKGVL